MDDGYEYLGNGPEATGSGAGCTMRDDLYARGANLSHPRRSVSSAS
jgi:hypothetical protein